MIDVWVEHPLLGELLVRFVPGAFGAWGEMDDPSEIVVESRPEIQQERYPLLYASLLALTISAVRDRQDLGMPQ
jgi:hypothetical protein